MASDQVESVLPIGQLGYARKGPDVIAKSPHCSIHERNSISCRKMAFRTDHHESVGEVYFTLDKNTILSLADENRRLHLCPDTKCTIQLDPNHSKIFKRIAFAGKHFEVLME